MVERNDEECSNIEEFLEHFEKHIFPIFNRKGIIKNTALQVYSMYCFNGVAVIEEPPDEIDIWKK